LESTGRPRHFFDNTIIAFVIAFLVMTATFIYSASLWADLFAFIVSWVATDIIFSLFIAGGSGIFIFKPFSTETLFKGRAYLLFLGMIVFSTYASSWVITTYLKNILTSQDTVMILGFVVPKAILVTNFLTGLFAFGDFNARFYQREKQQQ
jgi:hypothetical protein